MAELDLIKIWNLKKSDKYSEDTRDIPEQQRDWLPVTQQIVDNKRETVRVPYPIGDYDRYVAASKLNGENIDCALCAGTGVLQSGETCPMCKGTGIPSGSIGAISVDAAGVINLQLDPTTMGVNSEGKLFAAKSLLYSDSMSENNYNPALPLPLFVVSDEKVKKVKLHISLDIRSTQFESATEVTRFSLNIHRKSALYCWDKTVPYTMLNFDEVIELASYPTPLIMTLTPVAGDNFNHSEFTVSANVVSC